MERPSKVAVPRPISSSTTKERSRGLIEDRRRLDHLDHEGRAAAGEVVGGADPAEQAIDDADMGRLGRHERADLREHDDQRVLAEVGGLAGHVRPGHDQDAGAGVFVSPPSLQSLPTKLAPSPRAKVCSTMGWRPSTTAKTGLSSTFGRA